MMTCKRGLLSKWIGNQKQKTKKNQIKSNHTYLPKKNWEMAEQTK